MIELEPPHLLEAAARAAINARISAAYLHDVRGGLQAVYSALELLYRSAKSAIDHTQKMERARELAKRAINSHERSTLSLVELLTSIDSSPSVFNLEQLALDVAHLLRNDGAAKAVKIIVIPGTKPRVEANRDKFQLVLTGLFVAAIDATPRDTDLKISVERHAETGVILLDSQARDDDLHQPASRSTTETGRSLRIEPHLLAVRFAQQFLASNGGGLDLGDGQRDESLLRLSFPSTHD